MIIKLLLNNKIQDVYVKDMEEYNKLMNKIHYNNQLCSGKKCEVCKTLNWRLFKFLLFIFVSIFLITLYMNS